MPKFNYVAMDSRGKETKGTLEVANQNEAIGRIKEMGFYPTKVVEDKGGPAGGAARKAAAKSAKKGGVSLNLQITIPGLSGRVKTKVLTTFTRQLATLVQAGLPLLRGLRVLQKQEKSANLKGILGDLSTAIEGGSTFSEALAQHPKVFNRLFVNMVKAGEIGGVLEVVLKRLSEFMEKAQKIKRQDHRRHVLSLRRHRRGHVHHGHPDGGGHPQVQRHFRRLAGQRHGAAPVHQFRHGRQRHDQKPFHPHHDLPVVLRRDFQHRHPPQVRTPAVG